MAVGIVSDDIALDGSSAVKISSDDLSEVDGMSSVMACSWSPSSPG